ncbi:RNA polymerase sigma factor [Candidatus Poribacteria bacterium]|jgi:hypothetical protein|nr:RNA polymerase sigma factor [Candidatus Poribacteria bacterium]MBT5535258.1 RNA polymerase sigma factor [Candidatus Poribacteria bacterium]MBT5714862.1 RNA polymerase sigma factor [Candidatus Poribacteria bacterium]MBT7097816.1 RNA polymerase sigma factor [Candidatus Poribacteria bacterium]MBT7807145.1 RNA polymerase sigma factor [Candidatus Poribacteria bacterium]
MAWRGRRPVVPLDDLPAERGPVDVRRDADVDMEQGERWAHVRAVLARLPEKSRLALTLHYLSDWSYADIAEFLDVPVTTVVGRLHRARRLMQERLEPMVRDTFDAERLEDGHIAGIVAAAIEKTKQAQERWERVNFLAGADEALAALDPMSSDPEIVRGRVEVLGMRGDARATWIGDGPGAVRDYLHAIATADEAGGAEDAARLCKDLVAAYLRGGQYEPGRHAAENARERFEALGDHPHGAMMRAAVDLCDDLDGAWRPGEPGGYVMGVFPLRRDERGLTFDTPVSVRNYTWGRPSPSVALAWLLYPARVLGPDVTVGASWEDRITDRTGHNVLWGLPDGPEIIARSTVESDDDTVVTPAGEFRDCLRVRTTIAPPDGRVSPEYVARSHSGVRSAWYAPGVGCVKARHEDQNHVSRTVVLAAYSPVASSDYFPVDIGREWRYRWSPPKTSRYEFSVYTDTVRVTSSEDGVACLSSATVGVRRPEDGLAEHIGSDMCMEEASQDWAGKAGSIEQWLPFVDDAARRRAMLNRLVQAYEALGRDYQVIDARWRLRETDGELTPRDSLSRGRELLAAADADDDWHTQSKSMWLVGLALRGVGDLVESQTALRASAGKSADAGDLGDACARECWADQFLLEDDIPADDAHGYACGDMRLQEIDSGLHSGGATTSTSGGYPPGAAGAPLTSLPMHGPYQGVSLLGQPVGTTHTERNNVGMPWGTESKMVTSTLIDGAAVATTPCGRFEGCAVIESRHEVDVGNRVEHPDRERILGYTRGKQLSWFAPGVGLVRVRHEHDNGLATDLLLRRYSIEGGSGLLPLHIDNRWEYASTDEATGTVYEDFVRVAAKVGATWAVVFTTRATATSAA